MAQRRIRFCPFRALAPVALSFLLAAPVALAAEENVFLYFAIQKSTGDNAIARSDLDGNNLEELVQVTDDLVFGVSVNPESGYLFYTTGNISPNSSTVWRASVKGEDPEVVYNFDSHPDLPGTPTGRITGIEALGGDDRQLLWLDTAVDYLYSGEESGEVDAIPALEFPNGEYYYLAVDTVNDAGYVFDYTHSDLYKVTPEPTLSYALVTLDGDPLSNPSAIALDVDSQVLYWGQTGANSGIWRVKANGGTGAEQIHEGSYSSNQGGLSLDLEAGMAYWADYNLRRIWRGAMDGSGDVETVLTLASGTGPKGVTVVDLPEPDPRLGALAGLALLALFCERRRLGEATERKAARATLPR